MQAQKLFKTFKKDINIDISEVTLLSAEEAEALLTSLQRATYPLWWWLRSPGSGPNCVAYVYSNGTVFTYGSSVLDINHGVRPALRICNPEPSDLVPGESFEAGGERWTLISDDLALCDRIVGKSAFRTDYKAPYANDYEKSDVKKWLENWALERGLYTTAQLEQMQGRA